MIQFNVFYFLGDRTEIQTWILCPEPEISRDEPAFYAQDADNGLKPRSRACSVAGKAFSGSYIRHPVSEKCHKRLTFRQVVILRSSAVGIYIIYV